MILPIYQIDAFAEQLFSGNPAAVVPLESWIDATLMQQIATENNLAETAFFVHQGNHVEIRWFTPEREIDLCGHATLAAAHVLFHELNPSAHAIHFESRSGKLVVTRTSNNRLTLDFPSQVPDASDSPAALLLGLKTLPSHCLKHTDYIAVYESEEQIRDLYPDLDHLMKLDLRGVIVTAPSSSPKYDFVSRFFAPKYGISEDPVTGSSHTQLTPYWAKRLGKTKLTARQLSKRGGTLYCRQNGDRVLISGSTQKYLAGKIQLP